MIGIKKEKRELKKRIKERFLKWLKKGLIKEVINLRDSGISFKRIEDFGIHYRVIAKYLQYKIGEKEMIENSIKEIQDYAKRQMTWFKRDNRISWTPPTYHPYRYAEKLVKNFLK